MPALPFFVGWRPLPTSVVMRKKEGAPQRTLGAPHGDGEHFMSVRVNINRVDVSEILQGGQLQRIISTHALPDPLVGRRVLVQVTIGHHENERF